MYSFILGLILLQWSASVVLAVPFQANSAAKEATSYLSEKDISLADLRPKEELLVEVISRPRSCVVKVNGKMVLFRSDLDGSAPTPPGRLLSHQVAMQGTYVVAVNPSSGAATGTSFAYGHNPNGAFVGMQEFLRNVQAGRIIAFCSMGETFLSMDDNGVALFQALNTSFAADGRMGSRLAMVAVKDGPLLAEGYSASAAPLQPGQARQATVRVAVAVPRTAEHELSCSHLEMPENSKLLSFCEKYDGYGALCDCSNPAPTHYPPKPFQDGTLFEFPVIIMASNRPQYLYRCLSSLLPVRGLNISRLVVFVDGEFPEVVQLLDLLGVTMHQHVVDLGSLASSHKGTHIAYTYRYSIERAFQMFPDAEKIVLLEEDLDVSPDFLSFFQQTHHLLDRDVSLYCISAWNDNGYKHSVGDPALLYRAGFLPGLGWMLKRTLFFDEILLDWPQEWNEFDWDVFLRLRNNRRGRDCVIPDVSRTYHFGFTGFHVRGSMQYSYYEDHAINNIADVQLRDVDGIIYPQYQKQLRDLIRNGTPLNNDGATTCKTLIPSDTKNQTYLIFMEMTTSEDKKAWQVFARCFELWDMDARGDHEGVWRFWYNGNHILAIGVPHSRFSTFATAVHGKVTVFSSKT